MNDLDLVFDIGANNGDDAAAYLKRGCRVVAVEANPTLCAHLRVRFSSEIEARQLTIVDKAISHRPKATLYINTKESGWGTTLLSYAERGKRLRGEVEAVEVETTTVVELIRQFGVPSYLKCDIEGLDLLVLHDLMDSELPPHLSIERPKSLADQMFAFELLRRLGYRRFALVDQREEHDRSEERRTVGGVSGDEIAAESWAGWTGAAIKNVWLYAAWAFGGIARRTPVLRAVAPRVHWFDIHAVR